MLSHCHVIYTLLAGAFAGKQKKTRDLEIEEDSKDKIARD